MILVAAYLSMTNGDGFSNGDRPRRAANGSLHLAEKVVRKKVA